GAAAVRRAADHERAEGRNDAGDHWRDRQRIRHGPEWARIYHRLRVLKPADRPDVRGARMGFADRPVVLRRRPLARAPHPEVAGRTDAGRPVAAWRGRVMIVS